MVDRVAASQARTPLTSDGPKGRSESHAERRPASARALRVRIAEHKSLADEARVVVERGAVEKPQALRVDEHLRSVGTVEDMIARSGLGFPRERIAQPGA